MGMKNLLITFGFAFWLAAPIFAAENSLLARITVYWPGEGQVRACSNGARLRTGHCAVDPKRIPFGSRVMFPDTTCIAVDSGPAVVSRKAARTTGPTCSQRNAVVIDRFFESKETALSWAASHPQFMTVRIFHPGSSVESQPPPVEVPATPTKTATFPQMRNLDSGANSNGMELARPVDSLIG